MINPSPVRNLGVLSAQAGSCPHALPFTGAHALPMLGLSAILLVVGAACVRATRQRTQ